ncbi:unnamed protein product, partial [Dicrocoelium dendriticum]
GCIGTTVNRGPAEAAFTFLKPDLLPIHPQSVSLPGSPPILDITGYADAQNKLRVCFRRLLQSSHQAICLNRKVIGPDQLEYHLEMERQYNQLESQLKPLLELV